MTLEDGTNPEEGSLHQLRRRSLQSREWSPVRGVLYATEIENICPARHLSV